MRPDSQRMKSLDIAKGMAILAVVVGHFHPSAPTFPLYDLLYRFIYSFHMPLFMLISGYLYAYSCKIANFSDYYKFLRKKFLRLMVPYVSISLIILAGKLFMGGFTHLENPVTPKVLWQLLFNPLGGFASFLWFIYALMVIFVIVPPLEMFIRRKVFILAVFACLYFLPAPEIFCLNQVFKYLFFFYVGAIICKRQETSKMFTNDNTAFLLFSILFFVSMYCKEYCSYRNVSGIVVSFMGCMTFWFLARVLKSGGVLGRFFYFLGILSSSIYLLHTSIMGPVKLILKNYYTKDGLSFVVSVIAIVSAGVVIPIFLQKYVINKSKILSNLILGSDPR